MLRSNGAVMSGPSPPVNSQIDLPVPWRQAADDILAKGGIGCILGAASSGKTTFLRYLIEKLSACPAPVAVVDADIGQSTLGPPATISAVLLRRGRSCPLPENPGYMYFVGSTTPAGHHLQCLSGVKAAAEWGMKAAPFAILVDTTGMVQGRGAWSLKRNKIDLLRPRHLFVLQQGDELGDLYRPFMNRAGLAIHRLPISSRARQRSPEERKTYRAELFKAHFSGGSTRIFRPPRVNILSGGRPSPPEMIRAFPRSLLVGLNDTEQSTLALGILEGHDRASGEFRVYTALRDIEMVKYVVAGSLRIDRKGQQLPEETDWRRA